MPEVPVPAGVTPRSAQAYRAALAALLPPVDPGDEEEHFQRVQYALFELLAAMTVSGQREGETVQMIFMICTQVMAQAAGHAEIAQYFRRLAVMFEEEAAATVQ